MKELFGTVMLKACKCEVMHNCTTVKHIPLL